MSHCQFRKVPEIGGHSPNYSVVEKVSGKEVSRAVVVRVRRQGSFPRFPFIVYVSSQAMHSVSIAATFEKWGLKLPASFA